MRTPYRRGNRLGERVSLSAGNHPPQPHPAEGLHRLDELAPLGLPAGAPASCPREGGS